ncbi:MAG: hypothetical protein ABSG89_13325 [Bacteroidales bacterium]|jgi:hypothetical protein
METKYLKSILALMTVMALSCDEPETIVTDIVHQDGSVTRKLEMRNTEKKFNVHNIQVPFDSTWTVRDSVEISKKGDTTWVKRAEKFYKNAEEINKSYHADSGSNRDVSRRVEFRKKFRWFNTNVRFSEVIDKRLSNGYPVSDFLDKEELNYFYSPGNVTAKLLQSPDSLRYKALKDSVSSKTERWTFKSAVADWISVFTGLTGNKAEGDISFKALKARENDLVRIFMENGNHFDSLWKSGTLLKEFIGEKGTAKYKTEADSAMSTVESQIMTNFHEYTVRIVMPGKLLSTSGFVDSLKNLTWPVSSDFFLTQPYKMWAESKISNIWAWVVSGAFLLFVLAGIIFKSVRKRQV